MVKSLQTWTLSLSVSIYVKMFSRMNFFNNNNKPTNILELPGEPGVPDVIEVTDTTVTLHWKPPQFDGNSPIQGYIVEHHDKDEFMV